MSKRFFSLSMAIALLVLAVIPAVAQDDEFVFGMVLVGPRDDRGWSEAHYNGGLYVEENVPGARMLVFESLNAADTPETTLADVVELFVDEGAQLIFTTSDAFEEDTDTVAEQYPDVTFINISGDNVLTGESPANVGNLMSQGEWTRLISGCAAALETETGKLAYLGPLINAETRRLAISNYLGAKYCYENYREGELPPLEFEVTWIGFWFAIPGVTLDVSEETNAFFDRGFDVVQSGLDTTEMVTIAGQRAAEGENTAAVAYNFPEGCSTAPESCLGVAFYNWGPVYAQIAMNVISGEWEQSWDWIVPDFSETSIADYAPGEGLSEESQASLEAFTAELMAYAADEDNADTVFLWEGPLTLQDGTVLAEEGEKVDILDIWYIEQLLDSMVGASE